MISRIGLALAGLAATLVLAAGIAAAGIGQLPVAGTDAANAGTQAGAATGDSVVPGERSVTETVYVRPAAKPRIVHVTRRVRSTPRSTPIIARSRRHEDRERDERDEREGRERGERGERGEDD
jgi:hypothetical protein